MHKIDAEYSESMTHAPIFHVALYIFALIWLNIESGVGSSELHISCDIQEGPASGTNEVSQWTIALTITGLEVGNDYSLELFDDYGVGESSSQLHHELLSSKEGRTMDYYGEDGIQYFGIAESFEVSRRSFINLPIHTIVFVTRESTTLEVSQFSLCMPSVSAEQEGTNCKSNALNFPPQLYSMQLIQPSQGQFLLSGQPVSLEASIEHKRLNEWETTTVLLYLDGERSENPTPCFHFPRNQIYPDDKEIDRNALPCYKVTDGTKHTFLMQVPALTPGNHTLRMWLRGIHHRNGGSNATFLISITVTVQTKARLPGWAAIKHGPPTTELERLLLDQQPVLAAPQPGWTAWNRHLRDPTGLVLEGPTKLLYIVDDPVRTLQAAFAAGPDALLELCQRAGCLLPLLLEHMDAGAGLDAYVRNGVDFLLPEHHFSRWWYHTDRSYSIMFVKADALAESLGTIAEFLDAPELLGHEGTLEGPGSGSSDTDGGAGLGAWWAEAELGKTGSSGAQRTGVHGMVVRFREVLDLLPAVSIFWAGGKGASAGRGGSKRGSHGTQHLVVAQSVPVRPKVTLAVSVMQCQTGVGSGDGDPLLPFEIRDWCHAEDPAAAARLTAEEWIPLDQLRRVAGSVDSATWQGRSTVIVTNANLGYVDFAVNLWLAYSRLGQRNLLIIAEDCQAYAALVAAVGADHVARPVRPDRGDTSYNSDAQAYDSPGFRRLTAVRPVYLLYLLRRGFDALWQDVDSVPLRSPADVVATGTAELVLIDDSSNTRDEASSHYLCSCFIYLRGGRDANVWLLNRWKKLLELTGASIDQPALNLALKDLMNPRLHSCKGRGTLTGFEGWNMTVLPRRLFPNGEMWATHRDTALWVHANYREGKANKVGFLRDRGVWFIES